MRSLLTAAAAIAALGALAPAAGAQAGATVTHVADGVQTTMGNDQSAVSIYCLSESTGAKETEIVECSLVGADGQRWDALRTGPKASTSDAAAGAFLRIPEQRYQVCVRTRLVLHDGTSHVTPLSCADLTRRLT